MSKQIDWSQPLSDEDRTWAEQFPGLHAGLLEANAIQFPPKSEPSLDGDDSDEVPYDQWTKAELVTEAKRRNSQENKSLKVTGTIAELAAELEADDEASA